MRSEKPRQKYNDIFLFLVFLLYIFSIKRPINTQRTVGQNSLVILLFMSQHAIPDKCQYALIYSNIINHPP